MAFYREEWTGEVGAGWGGGGGGQLEWGVPNQAKNPTAPRNRYHTIIRSEKTNKQTKNKNGSFRGSNRCRPTLVVCPLGQNTPALTHRATGSVWIGRDECSQNLRVTTNFAFVLF